MIFENEIRNANFKAEGGVMMIQKISMCMYMNTYCRSQFKLNYQVREWGKTFQGERVKKKQCSSAWEASDIFSPEQ